MPSSEEIRGSFEACSGFDGKVVIQERALQVMGRTVDGLGSLPVRENFVTTIVSISLAHIENLESPNRGLENDAHYCSLRRT